MLEAASGWLYRRGMSSFDYNAPAELFLSKRAKGCRTKYRRFATSARRCGWRSAIEIGIASSNIALSLLQECGVVGDLATVSADSRHFGEGGWDAAWEQLFVTVILPISRNQSAEGQLF